MSADTSFDFGWNQARDNAEPWGRPSGAGLGGSKGTAKRLPRSEAMRGSNEPAPDPNPVSNAVPASEWLGNQRFDGSYPAFFGVCDNDLQVDAFTKCVMMQFNLAREEIRKMAQAPAPQSTGAGSGTTTGQRQGSTTGNRQRSGLQFLKVEQMTRDMREARIMDYQLPPDPGNGQRKFNDVILKLYYNGGIVLWGLKFTSPNYQTLYEIMGPDFDEWKEKKFLLGTEVREFDQRVFAHVEPIPASGDGKKKKR